VYFGMQRDSAAAPIPVIELRGTPAQRGAEHGRLAAARIHAGVRFYTEALRAAGLTPETQRELTSRMAEEIEAFDRALLLELEGIARGAGIDLAEIVTLNGRSELLHLADDGCTAIACLPEVTRSGHTLLAQNWDWHPSRRGAGVLLRILPDEGPAMLTFTEAGTLARCGLNEHGVGVVGNALECVGGSRPGGVPVALLRRRMLSCTTLQQAVSEIRSAPRGTTVNHLLASSEGLALSCEATVDAVYDVAPREGLLEHSNHFRGSGAQGQVQDTGIARTPDTLARDRRLRALAASEEPLTPEDLQRALADHDGFPNSICRHAEHVDRRTWVTVVSVVMDLDERRMWLAPGPVCENAFAEHHLAASA
jgi:isopenicillin-N N-acyltransferase-like protein